MVTMSHNDDFQWAINLLLENKIQLLQFCQDG